MADNNDNRPSSQDSIHVIVPMDRTGIPDLTGLITDVAVIEEHLKNQDKMLEKQNEEFEKFKSDVRSDIEKTNAFGTKQLIGIYTSIIGSTILLAGWLYYWILDAATHIKTAVGQ